MTAKSITQERLKEVLFYSPQFGIFVWKRFRRGGRKGSIAGSVASNRYWVLRIDRVDYYAHRIAFLYMLGSIPDQVDHVNGVRADNSFSNLRPATAQLNNRNKKVPVNSSSGIMGVSWHKTTGKWRAHIKVNRKFIHLGMYSHIFEAAASRKSAELFYGFHPNHGRAI